MNFTIRKVAIGEVRSLQKLSKRTFQEAYSETNTPTSMKIYMEEKFSLENLSIELSNPKSEFYFIEHNYEKMGFL